MAKVEAPEAASLPPVSVSASAPASQPPVPIEMGDVPAFFPTISRAPPGGEPRPIRKLNGADDLLGRLHLVPLYNATVKQFLRNVPEGRGAGNNGLAGGGGEGLQRADSTAGNAAGDGSASLLLDANSASAGGERGVKRGREEDANPFLSKGGETAASSSARRKGLPKTIENYVAELPGRVVPPRKLLSKADYHEQTMREIIYRPETTIQNIIPFDRETLESAFRVSAGEVPGIDTSLLEPDQMDSSSPRKKRKNKSKQKPAKT
ncbi:hypothetical protein OC834_005057 [Tilletia horrida]|nr:hypothetical protein OC834_005057 [Tilletia horrida]